MFELSEIPKNPSDALKAIIAKLVATNGGNATIGDLKNKGHPLYSDLVIGTTAAMRTAERMSNRQVAETIVANLTLRDGDSIAQAKERFRTALELAVALDFDAHFIDGNSIQEFDQANVPAAERDEIRSFLERAKTLAASADFLKDKEAVLRSFIHKVNLAENELFKETVGIQAFFAAAYQASRLVKTFGEDAQPLADAIETARTKTERHVEGYKQIAAEEKPKQLPKPDVDSDGSTLPEHS